MDEGGGGDRRTSWVPFVLKTRLTEDGRVEVQQANEEQSEVTKTSNFFFMYSTCLQNIILVF